MFTLKYNLLIHYNTYFFQLKKKQPRKVKNFGLKLNFIDYKVCFSDFSGRKPRGFSWQEYLEEQKAVAAPSRLFRDVIFIILYGLPVQDVCSGYFLRSLLLNIIPIYLEK